MCGPVGHRCLGHIHIPEIRVLFLSHFFQFLLPVIFIYIKGCVDESSSLVCRLYGKTGIVLPFLGINGIYLKCIKLFNSGLLCTIRKCIPGPYQLFIRINDFFTYRTYIGLYVFIRVFLTICFPHRVRKFIFHKIIRIVFRGFPVIFRCYTVAFEHLQKAFFIGKTGKLLYCRYRKIIPDL